MAEAQSQSVEQCLARTADGDRCSRPADDDGFCFQHDAEDQTVSDQQQQQPEQEHRDAEDEDEAEAESEPETEDEDNDSNSDAAVESTAETESADEQQDTSEESAESASDTADDESSEPDRTDPEDVDTSDVDTEHDEIEAVLTIRRTVQSTAGALIGRPFDGVSEISPTNDGWRAVVEVVERASIPDTQDVIGRYEIDLGTDGVVTGYRRLDRYRRGDTQQFE